MNFQTKQNVKNKKVSAKDAYDRLYPLVGEEYSRILPTMRWLKNLVEGRKIVQQTNSAQNKKLDFKKKKYKR